MKTPHEMGPGARVRMVYTGRAFHGGDYKAGDLGKVVRLYRHRQNRNYPAAVVSMDDGRELRVCRGVLSLVRE